MRQKALRRFPHGAEIVKGGVNFRVWAPLCKEVAVHLLENNTHFPLEKEREGYFSATLDVKKGALYKFRLDEKKTLYPDPASRYQPEGPSGPSCVIDPYDFKWTDTKWKGVERRNQVIYELHIGTFTKEGTWRAAIQKLPILSELGVTVIEMMPIAQFPGHFNWGYDGVNLFAPTHQYGHPDDLKEFIDKAHHYHLAVILDVVYNHFGPEGNYINEFSNHFFKEEKTEWGAAINFDQEESKNVRAFFIANAGYWIEEFHFDGFRFDACHAFLDSSSTHILIEIVTEARRRAQGKKLYITGENERQEIKFVFPEDQGGYNFDAIWNEDFHHAAYVKMTGHNEAYYYDYLGKSQEFISSAKFGFLYQSQWYEWQLKKRGTPALNVEASHFINFLQNHDQVANSPGSLRSAHFCSASLHRAMTALFLLMPQTPLLFQGQEFGATTPFYYFSDLSKDLAPQVFKGRIEFMSQFKLIAKSDPLHTIPKPHLRETFLKSKLNWQEKESHPEIFHFHKDLIQLRKTDPAFSDPEIKVDGAILDEDVFLLRYFSPHGDRLLVINMGMDFFLDPMSDPLLAPPLDMAWEFLWTSEDKKYGGFGSLIPQYENRRLTGPSATLFIAKEEEFDDETLYPLRER